MPHKKPRFAAATVAALLALWTTATSGAAGALSGSGGSQAILEAPDEISSPTGRLLWASADRISATPLLSASEIEQSRLRQAAETPGVTEMRMSREEIRRLLEVRATTRLEPCKRANSTECVAEFFDATAQTRSCYRPFAPFGPHPERPALVALRENGFESFLDMLAVVATGEISGVTNGFDGQGTPATLLRVEIDRWLRRPADTREVDVLYVVYGSNALFQAGGLEICPVRPGWSAVPTVGSRIALFGDEPVATEAGLYFPAYTDGIQMAWDTPSGMRVPNDSLRQVEEFRLLSFDEFTRALRRAVRRGVAR